MCLHIHLLATKSSGYNYVLQNIVQNTVITEIEFTDIEVNQRWGYNTDVSFEYIDHAGNQQVFPFQIPDETTVDSAKFQIGPIDAMYGTFKLPTADVHTAYLANCKFRGITAQTVDPIKVWTPRIFERDIIIPAGNYQPDQLAKTITDLCSEVQKPYDIEFGLNSNFFHVSNSFDELDGPEFIHPTQFGRRLIMKPNQDVLLGASQVSVEFDPIENRFKIPFLHTPAYDQQGNISVGLYDGSVGKFVFDKHSGIFITKLESKYVDGSYYDLFGDTLGFDVNDLLIGIEPPFTAGNNTYSLLTKDLENSINITGGFTSIDLFMPKNGTYVAHPGNVLGTSDITDEIQAIRTFDSIDSESGYYLIEVTGGFQNSFTNMREEMKFVSGIVSKYFSYKSYTSAGAESGITFQNLTDSTLHLHDFSIRIIDPNTEQVAKNIGADNTVIMQLN